MTTYAKVSDFTTIITAPVNNGKTEVFIVYKDADAEFVTAPKFYDTESAAQEAVKRIATNIFNPRTAASIMGSSTSEKKQAAARENGKKGGRPRKNQ